MKYVNNIWRNLSTLIGVMSISVLLFSGCAKKVTTVEPNIEKDSDIGFIQDKTTEEVITGEGGRVLVGDITTDAPDSNENGINRSSGGTMRPGSTDDENLSLGDIYFDYDKASISGEGQSIIAKNADFMKQNGDIVVRIEGHCDSRGTNQYNLALGDRRARAVKTYMAALGIPEGRVKTISFGEQRPTCKEDRETCWSQNRRVHFVIAQ